MRRKKQSAVSSPPPLPQTEFSTPSHNDQQLDLTGFFVAVFVWSIYLYTVYPGVAGGDSGELVVDIYLGGVPHPPGYPLLTVICSWWEWFVRPFPGSVAWKMNVMNSILGGITIYQFYNICRLLDCPRIISVCFACLYGFSSGIWAYSHHLEVFTLNNLLICWILSLTIKFCLNPSLETAYWGAFACGLAMTNQHTAVVYEVPIILYVFFRLRQQIFGLQTIASLGGYFLLGLSPYLVIIKRAWSPVFYSWGDSGTLGGFIDHVSRAEYGTLSLFPNGEGGTPYFERLALFLGYMTTELLWVGVLLFGFGLVRVYFEKQGSKKNACCLLLAQLIFYIGGFLWLADFPISRDALYLGVYKRFFIQPSIIVFLVAAMGMNFVSSFSSSIRVLQNRKVGTTLLLVFCGALVGCQIYHNFDLNNNHENFFFTAYGNGLVNHLPNNSLLLLNSDLPTNVAFYSAMCEGARPNVSLLSFQQMRAAWFAKQQHPLYPNIFFPGPKYVSYSNPWKEGRKYNISTFLRFNYDRVPIYVATEIPEEDTTWASEYSLVPFGLTRRIMKKAEVPPLSVWFDEWDSETKSIIGSLPVKGLEKYPPDSWESHYFRTICFTNHFRAMWILTEAVRLPEGEEQKEFLEIGITRYVDLFYEMKGRFIEVEGWAVQNIVAGLNLLIKYHPNRVWPAVKIYHLLDVYLRKEEAKRFPQYQTLKPEFEKRAEWFRRKMPEIPPADDFYPYAPGERNPRA